MSTPTSLISFACGFAEECSISRLIFTSEIIHGSKMKALEDFSLELYEKWRENKYTNCGLDCIHECCQRAKLSEYAYCPKCGDTLELVPDFDIFVTWISNLHHIVGNELLGDEFYFDWIWYKSWEDIMSIPAEQHLAIECEAESILVRALPADRFSVEKDKETWKQWYIENTGFVDGTRTNITPGRGCPEKDPTLESVLNQRVPYIRNKLGKSFVT